MTRPYALFVLTALFTAVSVDVPSRYLPWAPVELTEPAGPFTSMKLSRLRGDTALCESALSRAGVSFTRLTDDGTKECPLQSMTSLRQSKYPYSAPVRGECALTAALVMWENHAVSEAAALHLSSQVKSIQHLGVFSCRNVRNSSRRSQHAQANAIDIAAFTLADGQTISVKRDWDKQTEEGRFLRDVHARSCGIFRGVLGPEYNALHQDHFHLDLGPYRICR
ncbi:MAG: extensin [Micavibrio aeruginosavorus]|uniref:Extensin n=1 Tax=Micavibrio aeruginosavorus TaxID=349221 RepID=A0A2W4ZY36_9BACT|nr:MAG: extensin [Micavibrio aeruginosavorus]